MARPHGSAQSSSAHEEFSNLIRDRRNEARPQQAAALVREQDSKLSYGTTISDEIVKLAREFVSALRPIILASFVLEIVLVAALFPYHTEAPERITFEPQASDQKFYDQTYSENEKELKYVEFARAAAKANGVEDTVSKFVKEHHLENSRVLEVGAGSGLLQDQVQNYTGLDISATARRYFHKPFVQGDARAMPFRDGEFDAVWSIWVLEHVPNPEMALAEMRRVIRPNGLLLLYPAFMVSPLDAEGYHVRPFRDFGVKGKLVKLSIPLRESPLFWVAYMFPIRAIRRATLALTGQPTSFHYWTVKPNYDRYWEADSDAVNSLERYETYLWFKSRGDICLNCGSRSETFQTYGSLLIFRIKPDSSR